VVTLCASSLSHLRLFNVNLDSFEDPLFVDRDLDMLDFAECPQILHAPVNDTDYPSDAQYQFILDEAKKAKSTGKATLVHCFEGSRRSWCVARRLMMDLGGVGKDILLRTVSGCYTHTDEYGKVRELDDVAKTNGLMDRWLGLNADPFRNHTGFEKIIFPDDPRLARSMEACLQGLQLTGKTKDNNMHNKPIQLYKQYDHVNPEHVEKVDKVDDGCRVVGLLAGNPVEIDQIVEEIRLKACLGDQKLAYSLRDFICDALVQVGIRDSENPMLNNRKDRDMEYHKKEAPSRL
jgi:hypothetical protein